MFGAIMYSHEVGLAKPDPRIYAALCGELGVAPDELVFLDDARENVAAAVRLGIHGVLHQSTPRSIHAINSLIARRPATTRRRQPPKASRATKSSQRRCRTTLNGVRVDLVTIVVEEYDPAIEFFVGVLGFDLVADSPSLTNDGRPKRWVVVRPPGAETGILLARADGERQASAVGSQVAGRVGFFLQVDDFDAAYERMSLAGVEFITPPRAAPYGRVAVFRDIAGNRWDLLGPA